MSKLILSRPRSWTDRLHQRLHIDISDSEITVLQSSGLVRRELGVLQHAPVADAMPGDATAMLARLHQMLSGLHCEKMNVSISLAGSLLRLWMVTPPQNAASLADCQAAAGLRFHALFGESAGDWEISADWDARRSFLASAMPRRLLAAIHALCADYQFNLLRLEPQFVRLWNQFCGNILPNAWFARLEHQTLTIAALTEGRLVALRTTTAVPELLHQRSWLEQHLQREALLLNLAVPEKLQISGAIPAQWQKHQAGQIHCLPLAERLEHRR